MVRGDLSQPQFLAPILHVKTVSKAIVGTLYSDYGGVIYQPGILRHLYCDA
jgi:hypothetical protein